MGIIKISPSDLWKFKGMRICDQTLKTDIKLVKRIVNHISINWGENRDLRGVTSLYISSCESHFIYILVSCIENTFLQITLILKAS